MIQQCYDGRVLFSSDLCKNPLFSSRERVMACIVNSAFTSEIKQLRITVDHCIFEVNLHKVNMVYASASYSQTSFVSIECWYPVIIWKCLSGLNIRSQDFFYRPYWQYFHRHKLLSEQYLHQCGWKSRGYLLF